MAAPQKATFLSSFMHVVTMILKVRISFNDSALDPACPPPPASPVTSPQKAIGFPDIPSIPTFMHGGYVAVMCAVNTTFDAPYGRNECDVEKLLGNLTEFSDVSKKTYVATMVYIDRLCTQNADIFLSSRNIQRVLAGAFLIATEVLGNSAMDASCIGVLLGLEGEEVLEAGARFLDMIQFNVCMEAATLHTAEQHILGLFMELTRAEVATANLQPCSADAGSGLEWSVDNICRSGYAGR